MNIYKVTVNDVDGDTVLDTYWGIAENGKQAARLAMDVARSDRSDAVDEVAKAENLTPEEIDEEKCGELYASETLLVGEVQFGPSA